MAKLTRTESKERSALAKMVATILKTSARRHKWRVARDSLFKDHNGWFVEVRANICYFVEVQANISPRHFRTRAATRIKPMTLDPIFWDIVGLSENVKLPLSFRAFGAWVCAAPAISEDEIAEGDGSAEGIADNILEWANSQMALPMLSADPKTYVDFLQDRGDGYFASRVAMLCLMGRYEEARGACHSAIAQDLSGGFQQSAGDSRVTFPMMAINWLDRTGK
jgi:hypothetical protein